MRLIPLIPYYTALTFMLSGCSSAITQSDVETLAASGPGNSSRLASEICGKPATYLAGLDTNVPGAGFARTELLSWTKTSATEGAATARLVGTGILKKWPDEINLGRCEGVISFKYEFKRVDNGRAIVKESSFTEGPTVVKATR